ncbi:hypothetical protein [Coleofasciculus sp. FACHB-1120]|uniref:hypothetical protein n=1 Tax=Coleofasciculus sp. FACHB-1120 TaxID=2692783 RepID=UPI0016845ABA|nr:hypothetical protein [Coleofasciculus sp. FACHB-1120]MBD2743861.1 hypothetical protein [Coleofasciculus sp. FACHB-1120]
MQLHEREVTLKLNSRPLRLVYLVRNREDLINAVTLYTHVWGGAANPVLPIPENETEVDTFKLVLQWIDPDYIFVPREGISSDVDKVLEELPALKRPISNQEIQRHINGSNSDLLLLSNGTLSHMGFILPYIYPNLLNESGIRLIKPSGSFSFEIALQTGVSTQFYQDYLVGHLAAKVFSTPHTVEELIKVSLLTARLQSPVWLTMQRTTRRCDSLNHYIMETNDEETLCLFLDDGKDIGIATAFWNCRWLFPHNKLFLPREAFLKDIESHVSLIVEFMHSIRALFVTTPIAREDALTLCNILKHAFAAAGREILVKVTYRDFHFDAIPGTTSSGETLNFTRLITPDDSVRFEPPVPIGHEKTEFTFGYNAEVKLVSGRQLSMPSTQASSVLLTNELWRIEFAESNKDNLGELWLRQDLTVRAAAKGVTGTALSGRECRFYIHLDNIVITRQLKDAGFEVRPNKHTRYAQGCIKRFGGFNNVINLINKQGADIIAALVTHKAEQGGLYRENLKSFLNKQRGLSQKEADNVLTQKLPLLLENGLVRRGYSLCCPTCNLTDWYSLEEVREFIACRGCAENFQLPLHGLQFTYKPNELAARLVKEGGLAVLMTAALFNQIPRSGFIQFGGELLRLGEKTNFAEVDLFWLTGNAFIIAECKSYNNIDQQGIVEITDSLEKTLNVATLVDAQVVVLGVVTNSSNLSELFAVVADAAQKSKERGIGVHLALNGKLHLWGSVDGIEPWKVRLEELQVDSSPPEEEWSVGESPKSYGFGGLIESFDKNVLRRWEQELCKGT